MVKHMGCIGLLVLVASLLACGGQQLQRNQNLAKAARTIGEAYMRQGDYTAALGKLLEAEKLNQQDPIVYHDLGLCYRAKNRMEKALSYLEKAVKLKPNFSVARNTLGRVYIETGKLDQAIRTLKELTRDALYATPHFPLSNLGEAYFLKRDYPKSIRYYSQALNIQPDFIHALDGIGRTYVAMGKGRLALIYLEKALKLSPKVAQIHYDAAQAYELTGRYHQAKTSYKSVIELAPMESDMAKEALRRMKRLR